MVYDPRIGDVLGRIQQPISGAPGFDGCREWAMDGEPLAGFVLLDHAVPTVSAGPVGTELDHVGVREAFRDQPATQPERAPTAARTDAEAGWRLL